MSQDSDAAASEVDNDDRLGELSDALEAATRRVDGLREEVTDLRADRDRDRERIKQVETRIKFLTDDLNGMREWGTHMEQQISVCRRGLDDLTEAGRNLHTGYADIKRETTRLITAMEQRVAELEGGGDVDHE